MSNGIYSAITGSLSQNKLTEVVASNLSNTSTPGFKANQITFAEVLSGAGNQGNGAVSFVRPTDVSLDMSQGQLRPTNNKLDMGLDGPGFLCSRGEDEQVFYTRGGILRLSKEGYLTDSKDAPLMNKDDQPLKIKGEAGDLKIEEDGTVKMGGKTVGVLKIVEFEQPKLLARIANNRYLAPFNVEPEIAKITKTRQGQIEMSNVNVMTGMTAMITASRSYEAMNKIITTIGEIDRKAASQLGKNA